MHRLELAILKVFQNNPNGSFGTGDLVKEIFSEEYHRLREEEERIARFGGSYYDEKNLRVEKARLHRKLLYHLNKLLSKGIIKVSSTRGKGEKVYSLSADEGEIIVKDDEYTVVINKQPEIVTRLESEISKGVVEVFSRDNWINKRNSLLVEGSVFNSASDLYKFVRAHYKDVNDVIAINHPELLINNSSFEELSSIMEKLIFDSEDYNLFITPMITLGEIKDREKFKRLLRAYVSRNPKNFYFFFNITPKDVRRNSLLDFILQLFADNRIRLNIRNVFNQPEPVFFGRAGPYSLTPKECSFFRSKIKMGFKAAFVTNLAVAIDLHKLWRVDDDNNPVTSGSSTIVADRYTALRKLVDKAKKSLFEVLRLQDSLSIDDGFLNAGESGASGYFPFSFSQPGLSSSKASSELSSSPLSVNNRLFTLGKAYIRLWNINYDAEDIDNQIALFESLSDDLKEFNNVQRTLYRSLGVIMRLNISLASCFQNFDPDFLSELQFRKSSFSYGKELSKISSFMDKKVVLSKIFHGAERFRIFIDRSATSDERFKILKSLVLISELPTITMDFRGLSGELKLTNFF